MNRLRVAVTGGSGYLGTCIVRHLVELGHAVINIDSRAPRENSGTWRQADVRDSAQLRSVFASVDAVCHLAETPNILPRIPAEELYLHNVIVGATVLLTPAELKLQRVIYTSSCQVYGCWGTAVVPPKYLPLDEAHPLQPQNVYACAKIANEQLARSLAQTHGLSVAILRLPSVWAYDGAADWGRWFDGLAQFSDGCATYVGSDDAARAYASALEHTRPGCESYHFSAAEIAASIPLRELLAVHYPGFPQIAGDWPDFQSPLNCAKAREHLGWAPQFNARQIFRQNFGRDPYPPKPATRD